jgi:energy-coupling factor transporter ATP-binding protein EcfA2
MCDPATVSVNRRVDSFEHGYVVATVNPFATCFVRPDQNQYRFSLDPASESKQKDAFLQNLFASLSHHRLAAIVGPHGTGKTTLLRSIEPVLRERFSVVQTTTLSSSRRSSARELIATWALSKMSPEVSTCLIVDGYEQLRWWDRLSLVRSIKRLPRTSLIITCHKTPWIFPRCIQTRYDEAMSRMLTMEKLQTVPEPLRVEIWDRFEHRLEQPSDHSASERNLRELWFTMYDEVEAIQAKTNMATKRQTQ